MISKTSQFSKDKRSLRPELQNTAPLSKHGGGGLGNSPTKVSINSISPGIGLVPIPTLGVNDWINAPTAALQVTAPKVLTVESVEPSPPLRCV